MSAVVVTLVGVFAASVLTHGWPDPPSVVVVAPGGSAGPSASASPSGTSSPLPSARTTPSTPPSSAPQPSSDGVESLASVPLTSPDGLSATAYVGEEGALFKAVDPRSYNVSAGAVTASAKTCVETVVIEGVSASVATVYEAGLPTGLGAAEGEPPQVVTSGRVHQQLVKPLPSLMQEAHDIGASLDVAGTTTGFSTARLKLVAVEGDVATWSLNGKAVSCHIG